MMRIAVLGATGLTGGEVLRIAAARGIATTAIVRDPARLRAPADRVVTLADFSSASMLAEAASGSDAVIVTLGLNRRTRSPWAPLTSPPDVCSRAVGTLIEAVKQEGSPARVIYMSTYGASEQWGKLPLVIRALISTSKILIGYRDHGAAEAKLKESDIDWTIVRPTSLDDGASTAWIEASPRTSVLNRISRAAAATALVDQLAAKSARRIISITAPPR